MLNTTNTGVQLFVSWIVFLYCCSDFRCSVSRLALPFQKRGKNSCEKKTFFETTFCSIRTSSLFNGVCITLVLHHVEQSEVTFNNCRSFLSAAWKVIKSWLPAAAVKKIKFLTKSNLQEYVSEDQALVAWGGKLLAISRPSLSPHLLPFLLP